MEYSSIAIHSMLTQEQSDLIDKQQVRALKIIYGFDKSTHHVQEKSGLETLSLTRSKAVDRFAMKLVASPAFGHLFPFRPDDRRRSRISQKYLEKHANTSRLYNSPLYYMRRRLNALETSPGVMDSLRCRQGGHGSGAGSSQRCDFLYDEWQ